MASDNHKYTDPKRETFNEESSNNWKWRDSIDEAEEQERIRLAIKKGRQDVNE